MAANANAAAIEAGTDVEPDEAEAGATEASKKKFSLKLPSLKMMLIGAGGLALLAGVGGGAYYFFFAGHGHDAKPAAHAPKPAVFVDLPEVLVNLSNGSADHPQYLKIKVVLELSDQHMVEQIQPVMPRVMDAFQTYLRELRPTDLDGSAGLYRLKEELTRRVNTAIAPGRINAVLFKEIVVQ
jgi:flagellar protein FliL